MAIVPNRAYHNPALGQAFESLASAFAPPSASDLNQYAAADARRAEAARLADLYSMAEAENFDPYVFDRKAIAAGRINPTQSYYAQDQNTATARRGQDLSHTATLRGQDITAETSRHLNEANNQRVLTQAFIDNSMAPVAPGYIRPGADPADYGITGPVIEDFHGASKPLSTDEFFAGVYEDMRNRGELPDDVMLDRIMDDRPPVVVQGPDGPQYMHSGRAGRTGATPYTTPSRIDQIKNYQTPDGATGSAFFDPNTNQWVDAATHQPLPQGTTTFSSSLQGGAADIGLGPTNTNTTELFRSVMDTEAALSDIAELKSLLEANPGIAGLPGTLLGTAQDATASFGELIAAFGDKAPDAAVSADEIRSYVNRISGGRNPNIQRYNTLITNLAYLQARISKGGREVSLKDFEHNLRNLQGGFWANNQSAMEALTAAEDRAIRMRNVQRDVLQRMGIRNGGQPPQEAAGGMAGAAENAVTGGNPPQPPSPPSPPAPPSSGIQYATDPRTGEIRKFEEGDEDWVPINR